MYIPYLLSYQRRRLVLAGLSLFVWFGAAESTEQPEKSQTGTGTSIAAMQTQVPAAQAQAEVAPQSRQASPATEGNTGEDDAIESALKERVLARWQTLMRHDFVGAYEFNTPSYRALYSTDQFARNFGYAAEWLAANVESITLEEKVAGSSQAVVAKVSVILQYRLNIAGISQDADTTVLENWIQRDNTWWYVPEFKGGD